jgi:hypothetical protein
MELVMFGRKEAARVRQEIEAAKATIVPIDALPREGARWRRLADGSWEQWSYVWNQWEPQPGPPESLHPLSVDAPGEWLQGTDGFWNPI